jgi:hypothetical protein
MIFNKLQLITNYLDVGFVVGFCCSLVYSVCIASCLLAYSARIASCSIYNVILKFQKNDKKRRIYACYIYHNNEPRKKIKLE